MGIILLFLFMRGPLVLRVVAWGFVAVIVFTAIMLLFISPNGMPKGTIPTHAQHSHLHPSGFIRR